MKNLIKGFLISLVVLMVACSGLQLDTKGYVLLKNGKKIYSNGHTYFYSDVIVVCNKDKNIEISMDDVKEIKFTYGRKRIK